MRGGRELRGKKRKGEVGEEVRDREREEEAEAAAGTLQFCGHHLCHFCVLEGRPFGARGGCTAARGLGVRSR